MNFSCDLSYDLRLDRKVPLMESILYCVQIRCVHDWNYLCMALQAL
jgi:hypothetical protein